jgi:hypothetical protein
LLGYIDWVYDQVIVAQTVVLGESHFQSH